MKLITNLFKSCLSLCISAVVLEIIGFLLLFCGHSLIGSTGFDIIGGWCLVIFGAMVLLSCAVDIIFLLAKSVLCHKWWYFGIDIVLLALYVTMMCLILV